MAKTVFRIDDRLIHGQTVVAWCPMLQIKEIIAVDDISASNPMLKGIVQNAAPKQFKTSVVTSAQALDMIKKPAEQNRLVIVKYPEVLYKLKEAMNPENEIILGNLAKRKDTNHQLSGATGIFFLSDADIEKLNEMSRGGLNIRFQQLPGSAPVKWQDWAKSEGVF